ncbi:hypothetical protein [Streptomyces sp. NPDC002187]|uniref:hypothetical protein n=1 Tax=Streptomyces sp. NPDC002187 TaxID=3364637 RepID=UPI00367E2D8E
MYPHIGVDASGLATLRATVLEHLRTFSIEELQGLRHEAHETAGGQWRAVPVLRPENLTPSQQRIIRGLPCKPHVLVKTAREARDQIQGGDTRGVAVLVSDLGLRGERWHEAYLFALVGEWEFPREAGPGQHACNLITEARRAHLDLTPLWDRRTRGRQILLLDTPLGGGASLVDLAPGSGPDPFDEVTSLEFSDPRLIMVLNGLTPKERKVAEIFAQHGTGSWAEAATCAGESDPAAFGERVRRKLKRLRDQDSDRRNRQRATASGLWVRAQKGGEA